MIIYGEIQYARQIPEPTHKPGDLTVDLLKQVTEGAEPKPPKEYQQRTPTTANEVAKYLLSDVQGGDVAESMRFFNDSIIYRDFNLPQGQGMFITEAKFGYRRCTTTIMLSTPTIELRVVYRKEESHDLYCRNISNGVSNNIDTASVQNYNVTEIVSIAAPIIHS